MNTDHTQLGWKEYLPRTRNRPDIPVVKIHPSGHISVNEKAHRDWLGRSRSVKLFFNEETAQIGMQATEEGEKGLLLRPAKKARVRYVSARGFFGQFNVTLNSVLRGTYDLTRKMVVAKVSSNGNSQEAHPADRGSNVSDVNEIDDVELSEIRGHISEVLPPFQEGVKGKSIPQIIEGVRTRINLKGRWGRNRKTRLTRKVRNQLRRLLEERTVTVAGEEKWRTKNGKIKYFARVEKKK